MFKFISSAWHSFRTWFGSPASVEEVSAVVHEVGAVASVVVPVVAPMATPVVLAGTAVADALSNVAVDASKAHAANHMDDAVLADLAEQAREALSAIKGAPAPRK